VTFRSATRELAAAHQKIVFWFSPTLTTGR